MNFDNAQLNAMMGASQEYYLKWKTAEARISALEAEVEASKSMVERLIEAGDKMADDFEDAEDDRRSSNEWRALVAEWTNQKETK